MSTLISILVAVLVIAVLLWAIRTVISALAIPSPMSVIIWIIAVLVAVFAFLQISDLYTLHNLQ